MVGTLAAEEDGWFVATTDAGVENGFSRGHYRARDAATGDLEISVTATRLTDDHGMPIEIAFRGGFFGVTGTSQFYIYQSDGHWTGWKCTPASVGTGPLTLRVVQRGAAIDGFVNGALAGSFTLNDPPPEGPVGLFFKGPPGVAARMRFRDFTVGPPREQTPISPLIWGSYDEGVGDPHPLGASTPSGEPWDFAVLARADDDAVVARVWVATIDRRVVADFSFDDALGGEQDEAVLPLLVEGFFGDEGHTLGHYRSYDRFEEVRFTNLRTGASWWVSWEAMDQMVEAMKASPAYVPRAMR